MRFALLALACSTSFPRSFPEARYNTGTAQTVSPRWVAATTEWRADYRIVHTVCLELDGKTWCGEVREAL